MQCRMALLKEASEMFEETGCVPGIDGNEVRAEKIVPDVKEYIQRQLTTRRQSTTRRYGIHLEDAVERGADQWVMPQIQVLRDEGMSHTF